MEFRSASFIFLGMFQVVNNRSLSSSTLPDEAVLEFTCMMFKQVHEFGNHDRLQNFGKVESSLLESHTPEPELY